MTSLTYVIVNWNLKGDTLECLASLLTAGASPDQIVLVDNGSTDGSVVAICQRFGDQVNLICNPTNLGYVPALNQGIQYALQNGAEWVLLLNNDTVVAPDFLRGFSFHLASKVGYAILAPLIYYYSDPSRIWYLGDSLIPGTLLGWSRYHGKKSSKLPEILPVDFVSGCAMLVRRDVFEHIGLFDPELVMYGEEVDFIWRARLAGYRCAAITSSRMWHKISLSASRVRAQTRYLRVRNQARFYKRYGSSVQYPLLFIFSLVKLISTVLCDLIRRQSELIDPLFRGFWDGWRWSQ